MEPERLDGPVGVGWTAALGEAEALAAGALAEGAAELAAAADALALALLAGAAGALFLALLAGDPELAGAADAAPAG